MKIYKAASYDQILQIVRKIKKQYSNSTKTNILFRGSPYLKKVLHPRKYGRGKYVFASNLIDLAISYIRCGGGGTQEDVAQAVSIDPKSGNPVVHLIEMKKGGIKKMFECSGYLYILDSSKFKKSKFSQLKNYEFLSTKVQKPLAVIQILKLHMFKIIKEVAKRGGIKLHHSRHSRH